MAHSQIVPSTGVFPRIWGNISAWLRRCAARAEAIKRRAAGETLADIAKSHAVDISTISRLKGDQQSALP
jgi:hypothetical protein